MSHGSPTSWLPRWTLAALAFLLAFEPRQPSFSVAGLQITWLELAAGVAMLLLAWSLRRELPAFLRAPPPALAGLSAFALAHVAAAALAPAHRGASLVFSLRMVSAAAFGVLVAASGARAVRWALGGLAAAAGIAAVLAGLEGMGFQRLDPFLDLFRMSPFFLAGARRASGTSENPNLAAALLAQGLVAGVGLLGQAGRRGVSAIGFTALVSVGLLFTYSRGGLAAALVGLGLLAGARRTLSAPATPIVALAVLAVATLAFAAGAGFRRHLASEQVRQVHAAYAPADASLRLAPRELRRLSLRVTNAGATAWQPPDRLSLSCAWYSAGRLSDAGCDAPLLARLGPGQSVLLSDEVRAPEAPGSYYLVWEMFSELGRFSTLGVPPALVPAYVGDAAAGGSIEPPPRLVSQRTRAQLWRLAFEMWRERPLFGFGPDNFRKLHASFAGWPETDQLHAAHNGFLEVAATTGVAGLATLLATLLASVTVLRRALRRPGSGPEPALAAIVLGLLGAQLAQSCVDYLLSFTAHYLLFGLVVGAGVACARGYFTQRRTLSGQRSGRLPGG